MSAALKKLLEKPANGKFNWQVVVLIAATGILLMTLPNLLSPPRRSAPTPAFAVTGVPSTQATAGSALSVGSDYSSIAQYEKSLAQTVETALAAVAGAGAVKVAVTVESGPELKLGQNENVTERRTEEKDASGGSRIISEITRIISVVMGRPASGEEQPVVSQVVMPKVAGILVVAEGASSSSVKAELTRAVVALLHVPAYRVQVIPMKEGK